jgi:uncharacterized protein (DUF3820 family)
MTSDIIPFGKHRGKSVQEVATFDPQYLQWLSGQSWAQEKFPHLVNVTINNFGVPVEDTPEHNALQLKFTDHGFRERFVKAVGLEGKVFDGVDFEWMDFDVVLCVYRKNSNDVLLIEVKPLLGNDFPSVLRQMNAALIHARNVSMRGITPSRNTPDGMPRLYLLVDEYNGDAPWESVVQFFGYGVKVVLLSEL